MNKLLTVPHIFPTVADLLRNLGDIPPERIRLVPAPGTATAEDVTTVERKEKRLCELIDGVLVEKVMGHYESRLAVVLIMLLEDFVYRHDLGIVAGEAGTLEIVPGMVRIPDVSFVSWDRLPGRKPPVDPIPGLVPDLAIEVISAGNTKQEMERKLREYFKAGVRQVWYVREKLREFQVYQSVRKSRTYGVDDTVPGGKVLPGFELSVRAFFDRADRKR